MKFEEIEIRAEDAVKLHGWYMSLDFSQEKDTVVFLHENTGNLGMNLDYFETLVKKVGVNVLCVAYRGFSKSEGVPTEQGLILDGKAIAKYVAEKISKERVFLIGRSLGSSVALSLLQDNSDLFRGAVLENTWTSISEMVDNFYPIMKMFPILKLFLLKMRWDNLEKIKSVKCPLMFVSGDKDTFVPAEMTQRLYEQHLGKKREIFLVKGGNHNNTWQVGGDLYVSKLRQFIASHRDESPKQKSDKKVVPPYRRNL